MRQDLYIQMICEHRFEGHILKQNHKPVLMSDDIWKAKLEWCIVLNQLTGKTSCERPIGLIGTVRGTF